METVRMVTTSEHLYAGHRLKAGDEFECEPQFVELMQKLGRARRVEAQAQTYLTRDLAAASPRRARKPR